MKNKNQKKLKNKKYRWGTGTILSPTGGGGVVY